MSKHHHHHHEGCVRAEPEKLLREAVGRARASGLRRTKALEDVLSILIGACQPLTLAEAFVGMNLTAEALSMDTLDMHAHDTYQRFDRFNQKFSPAGKKFILSQYKYIVRTLPVRSSQTVLLEEKYSPWNNYLLN